jgi:hypothetical protein
MHAAVIDTQDKATSAMTAMTLWAPMAIGEEPALTTAVNRHHTEALRVVGGFSACATVVIVFRSRCRHDAPFGRESFPVALCAFMASRRVPRRLRALAE